ncbi:MAG: SBBP repeat-containing protein [Candidatus Krumholzibacteriia bacterium]
MTRTTRGGFGLLLALSLLLAACGRETTTTVPDGTIALTVVSYLGHHDGEVTRQGVPSDAAGVTGVTVAELRVFQGETERFFDADGRQVGTTAPAPQLTPANGSVTLFLSPGTYSFELTALDDAVGPNTLAFGELLDQAIADATTVTIPLRSYVGSASLSEPRIVQPNEIFEVVLGVHPPGRPDLQVPLPDYEVAYVLSDEALRIGDSKLGVRLVAACRDISIGATVSDTFQNDVQANTTILVQDLCPTVGAGIGADLIPPFVSITDPAEGSSVVGPITVSGEVNDMQSGVDRVEIYEGVVLLGFATIDTTSMPSTWTFTFSPLQARTYAITALALDNAGNEARTARALEGSPTLAAELLWTRQFEPATGRGVAVDPGGNVYVTGSTTGSFEGTNGGVDVFLRKFDPAGAVLWTRQYGTEASEEGWAVAVDVSGNAYVVGGTKIGNSDTDVLVLKYGPDGALLWDRQFGSVEADEDIGFGVAVDADGNAYVTGSTMGRIADDAVKTPVFDLFLRKYDPSGEVLWTQQVNAGADIEGKGVAVDGSGSGAVYVTGYTRGTIGSNAFAIIQKYGLDGELLWGGDLTFGSTDFADGTENFGHGVAVDALGDVYVAGTTSGSVDGTSFADAFLAKFGPGGDPSWTRRFGPSARDTGTGVAVDASGRVFVTGFTRGGLGGTNAGGEDAFLRTYDPDGNVLWTRQFGTETNDFSRGVAVDAAGHAYVTGTTGGSLDGTTTGGTFLAKYGP